MSDQSFKQGAAIGSLFTQIDLLLAVQEMLQGSIKVFQEHLNKPFLHEAEKFGTVSADHLIDLRMQINDQIQSMQQYADKEWPGSHVYGKQMGSEISDLLLQTLAMECVKNKDFCTTP